MWGDAADPATNGIAPHALRQFCLDGEDLMNRRRCGKMSNPQSDPQQFASDNYSGICPEAWAAMSAANLGHAPAYGDRKSTRLNSSHSQISYAVFCLKKKKNTI